MHINSAHMFMIVDKNKESWNFNMTIQMPSTDIQRFCRINGVASS
jgi:hypothetical protein